MSESYNPDEPITADLQAMEDDALYSLYAAACDALKEEHHTFIAHIRGGKTITEAYKTVYESKNDANASSAGSRLLGKVKIQNAKRLQDEIERRLLGLTVSAAMSRFNRLSTKAEEAGDLNNARSCFIEVVKLADLYPAQKSEHTHNHQANSGLRGLDDEQMQQLFNMRKEEEKETKH